MRTQKKLLSCKKVLLVIIFCFMSVVFMQLSVFADDLPQITTNEVPQYLSAVDGQSAYLSGEVLSNSKIDRLDIVVPGFIGGINNSGAIYTCYPNSNQCYLNGIVIDSGYFGANGNKAFPKPDRYDLMIVAEINGQSYDVASIAFNVLDITVNPVEVLKNVTVLDGESVYLSGRIKSNSYIERLDILVPDYSGGIEEGGIIYTCSPYSNEYDLNNIVIDSKYMDAQGRKAFPTSGRYDLIISAKINGKYYQAGVISFSVLNITFTQKEVPSELKVFNGESISLSGEIFSNGRIESVDVVLKDYYGGFDNSGIIDSYYSTHNNRFDLSRILINTNIKNINGLGAFPNPGKYDLILMAKVNGTYYRAAVVSLYVLDNETTLEEVPEYFEVFEGQSVNLSGRILSSKMIEKLDIIVSNHAGGFDEAGIINTYFPYMSYFDLRNIVIDSQFIDMFGRKDFPEPAKYNLIIRIMVNGKYYKAGSVSLNVLKNTTTSINVPRQLKVVEGKSVGLSGRILASDVIDRLDIIVKDYTGGIDNSGIIHTTFPYTNEIDLSTIIIDSAFKDIHGRKAFPEQGKYDLIIRTSMNGKLYQEDIVSLDVVNYTISAKEVPKYLEVVEGQRINLSGDIYSERMIERLIVEVPDYWGGFGESGIIYSNNLYGYSFSLRNIAIDSTFVDEKGRKAFPKLGKYDLILKAKVDDKFYQVAVISLNVLSFKAGNYEVPKYLEVVEGQSIRLSGEIYGNSKIDTLDVVVEDYYGGINNSGAIYSFNPNIEMFSLRDIVIDSNYTDKYNRKAFPKPDIYNLIVRAKV